MSERDDRQATLDARALRERGFEPLLEYVTDLDVQDKGGLFNDDWPRFTLARVHALLSVYDRFDLLTRANTRLTRGIPASVTWAPRWVCVIAYLGGGGDLGTMSEMIRRAEGSAEVRARNEERLVELRDAARAAFTLSGAAAASKILDARHG